MPHGELRAAVRIDPLWPTLLKTIFSVDAEPCRACVLKLSDWSIVSMTKLRSSPVGNVASTLSSPVWLDIRRNPGSVCCAVAGGVMDYAEFHPWGRSSPIRWE